MINSPKNNQVLCMYAMRMTASAIKTRRDGIAVLYSRAVVDVGHVEDLEEELRVCGFKGLLVSRRARRLRPIPPGFDPISSLTCLCQSRQKSG